MVEKKYVIKIKTVYSFTEIYQVTSLVIYYISRYNK